ncbi:hypothetical protein EYF80_037853 [Liparis tanakae]|uniref:Uncharacterized protein n=1 Tax=Liparis tanakae TaxID=230148 RepID=A0A4Z2GEE9_9TELE|nr:hypothetical protein EYF80_037853 [Liparis tanakae]
MYYTYRLLSQFATERNFRYWPHTGGGRSQSASTAPKSPVKPEPAARYAAWNSSSNPFICH